MRKRFIVPLGLIAIAAGGAARLVQEQCGPFTDVPAGICPYVLEMYYLGITAGTSATTFSPSNPVTRGQAAVFASKGFDQAVARSSRRAALGQWWRTTPQYALGLGVTAVGSGPSIPVSDGQDIWVPNEGDGTVARVRASDGRVVETWTGVPSAYAALSAMGRVVVTSAAINGAGLYVIDPTQAAGAATMVIPHVGDLSYGIAFDGSRIWVANANPNTGSVAIVTPTSSTPWTVTNVTAGFAVPTGIVFDGANIWLTDPGHNALDKLDSGGAILRQVTVGSSPEFLVFDGANIWVPNYADSTVSVVRVTDGSVLATLSGNGVSFPRAAAFDGERVLITNAAGPTGHSVSIWKAADFTPLGWFSTGSTAQSWGACSDGANFWITLPEAGLLARF